MGASRAEIPVVYHVNDLKLLCPSFNAVSNGEPCERCATGKFWHVVSEGCYGDSRRQALALAAKAYAHRWLRTYEKCVDLFIAPSEFVRHKLVASGVEPDRIQVLSHFQNVIASEPPPSGNSILYFGRLSAEKGVEDLLHAVRALPYIPVHIAGEGPQKAQLEGMAESCVSPTFTSSVTFRALPCRKQSPIRASLFSHRTRSKLSAKVSSSPTRTVAR